MSTCLYGNDAVVTPIRKKAAARAGERGPEALRDTVRGFLIDASATCRQLLCAAAVLGPRLDPQVLELMLGQSTVALLPVWEEALASGLLTCEDGEIRFAGEFAGDVGEAGEGVRRVVAEYLPPVIRDAIRSQYLRLIEDEPRDAGMISAPEPETSSVRAQAKVTPRERTVLALVAEGRANRQIARALGISDHAVKRHVSNLFIKFDCSNRTELALLAIQNGRQDPH